MDDRRLIRRLQHVYWIGGGTGAGKSTIARRIAAGYALQLYPTDDVMSDHAGRTTAEDSPSLSRFMSMDMDERWLNRSPQVMLETFHWFRRRLRTHRRRPTAASEDAGCGRGGLPIAPHLVRPLLTVSGHAVWLLPTAEFRQAAFNRRGSLWTIAGKTSDPERALHNLLDRDRMFTERLRRQTDRLDLNVIEVDDTLTEDVLTRRVAEAFGL